MEENSKTNSGFLKSQKSALFYAVPFIVGFLFHTLSCNVVYIGIFVSYFVIMNKINEKLEEFSTNISNASKTSFLIQLLYFAIIGVYGSWYFYLKFDSAWVGDYFWNVFYIALFADFLLKHITIVYKGIFMLTVSFLPVQFVIKRGNILYFIEALSQTIRCLVQALIWSKYFLQSRDIFTLVMLLIFAFYLFIKGKALLEKLSLVKHAYSLLSAVHGFILPVESEEDGVESNDSFCHLCHFDISNKCKLPCGHVYCRVCINTWFDKEGFCPRCMAKMTKQLLFGQTIETGTVNYTSENITWKSGRTNEVIMPF